MCREIDQTIRFAVLQDAPALHRFEVENFQEPWSVKNFQDCIASPQGRVVLLEDADANILGCVVFYYAADEGEIDSVVVRKDCRKCGIGGKLLHFLHSQVENYGVSRIFLEVRCSNLPAQKLYEKMGYEQVGKRPNFYHDPVEDAYIYKREQ